MLFLLAIAIVTVTVIVVSQMKGEKKDDLSSNDSREENSKEDNKRVSSMQSIPVEPSREKDIVYSQKEMRGRASRNNEVSRKR